LARGRSVAQNAVVEAVGFRTRNLLRRRWKATVGLALTVGLVGGLAIGAWAASRRGRDTYTRFVDRVAQPQYGAFFCAPNVTPEQMQEFQQSGCPSLYVPTDEMAFVRSLPGVEAVAAAGFVPVRFDVGGHQFDASITFTDGPDILTPSGNPKFVRGRAPVTPDEIGVSEAAARDFPLGTEVVARPLSFATGQPLDLPPQHLRLVGVGRFPIDLAVAENKLEQISGVAFVSPSWWAEWKDRVDAYGGGVLARLAPGTSEATIRKAVEAHWPGRTITDLPIRDSKAATVVDAIGYESNSLLALAVTVGLAGIVFVGQSLTRQSRREQADLPVLSALGFSRRQAVAAVALRSLPMAVGAAVTAGVVAWLSSAWTPIGLAAKAEPSPGLRVDSLALGTGAAAVACAVLVLMLVPTLPRPRRASMPAAHGTRLAGAAGLRPPGVAGVGMAVSRRAGGVRLGTALAATSIGAAVVVASATTVASLDRLVEQPARFGARWDAIALDDINMQAGVDLVKTSTDFVEAGAMYNTDGLIDGKPDPIVAMSAFKGASAASWITIASGRAPERDSEVALGETTMRELHAHPGSHVTVQLNNGAKMADLVVVGTAVFNNSSDLEAGVGVLISDSLMRADYPTQLPYALVLRLRPGVDLTTAMAPLSAAGVNWFVPTPPATIRNLERVRWLPWALAILVMALAAGALGHALFTSVRAHRRDLAVYRTLGFTPLQAGSAVLWESLALVGLAAIVGIPLGGALGRWGWGLAAAQIGVPSSPVVPLLVVPLVIGTMLVVAALIAMWPGWRAARVAPGPALRAE
jgi:putative ABC transport system permease protein